MCQTLIIYYDDDNVHPMDKIIRAKYNAHHKYDIL